MMAWVIDTSVLLDIRLPDPVFGAASAACLHKHRPDGLTLCPVSYVELAPAFGGDHALLQAFLAQLGVEWREHWRWRDTQVACQKWTAYTAQKRAGITPKRFAVDVLIEAFASRFQGLITRNPRHFPTVPVVVPA